MNPLRITVLIVNDLVAPALTTKERWFVINEASLMMFSILNYWLNCFIRFKVYVPYERYFPGEHSNFKTSVFLMEFGEQMFVPSSPRTHSLCPPVCLINLQWPWCEVSVTYVLQMNVSLAGDVVHHVPDVLLPAAADEVLLRGSVLHEQKFILLLFIF